MNTDKVIQIANFISTGNYSNANRGRVYSTEGISPCLNCVSGGGQEPKILVESNTLGGGRNQQVTHYGNSRINTTLAKYPNLQLSEPLYMDAYNSNIRFDGIAGCIRCGVSFRCMDFLIIPNI